MNEAEAFPHRRLRRIAGELALVQHQLRQLLGELSSAAPQFPRETDLQEIAAPLDRLRSTLECVLADRLSPALDDLLAAAAEETPGP